MSLYDIHKNNYRKGLVQFVGNFMFIIRCVLQTYEQLNHDKIGIFTKKKKDKLVGSF